MGKPARGVAGDRRPISRPAWAQHIEPIARAGLLHPVALVSVVTCPKIDQRHLVAVDHMLEQCGTERSAGRELSESFSMGQLVDEGGAALDRPQLRCNRLAITAGDPQPEPSGGAFCCSEAAEERR